MNNYSDDEEFVYTASVPIGLPIYATSQHDRHQDIVGVSINLGKNQDKFTYNYTKDYSKDCIRSNRKILSDLRVVTKDDITLLVLKPSNHRVSGQIDLSTTDRRYIRNNQTYLIGNINGNEINEPLQRIKIIPDLK